MEVAARLGGGHDAELVPLVTGVDLTELAVSFALGEPVVRGGGGRREGESGGERGRGRRRVAHACLPRRAGRDAPRRHGVDDAERGRRGRVGQDLPPAGVRASGRLRRGADRAGAMLVDGRVARRRTRAGASGPPRCVHFVVER